MTVKVVSLEDQILYCCHWGTMWALVWSLSPENAELRVRYQRFGRKLSLRDVTAGEPCVRGEVFVREATEDDEARWGVKVDEVERA